MPDDKNKKHPQDAKRINVNEPYELTFWSNKFAVSKDKLKQAVKSVGTSASAVKKYLDK